MRCVCNNVVMGKERDEERTCRISVNLLASTTWGIYQSPFCRGFCDPVWLIHVPKVIMLANIRGVCLRKKMSPRKKQFHAEKVCPCRAKKCPAPGCTEVQEAVIYSINGSVTPVNEERMTGRGKSRRLGGCL